MRLIYCFLLFYLLVSCQEDDPSVPAKFLPDRFRIEGTASGTSARLPSVVPATCWLKLIRSALKTTAPMFTAGSMEESSSAT